MAGKAQRITHVQPRPPLAPLLPLAAAVTLARWGMALAVLSACNAPDPRLSLSATLSGGPWSGRLSTSVGNAGSHRNGFDPLEHSDFPGHSLFGANRGGFFFEYIMDGATEHRVASEFSPVRNPHLIERLSASSATLWHPAQFSSWNLDSAMEFTMAQDGLDLEFRATLHQANFPHGYLLFMWANYMDHARERHLHYFGVDHGNGDPQPAQWHTFGEDHGQGFEVGTLAHLGAQPLERDATTSGLNITEHPDKKFVLPVFYGLVDGDADPATLDDTMAFIMMFDQADPIRFALWNFTRDPRTGQPDPQRPAWDWQFVVRQPSAGASYGYRARVLYVPFRSPSQVLQLYQHWARTLPAAPH